MMSSGSSHTSSEDDDTPKIIKIKRGAARAHSTRKSKVAARHKNMTDRKRPPEHKEVNAPDIVTRTYARDNRKNNSTKKPETDFIFVKVRDPNPVLFR
jgi:hypothetical protein